MGVCPDSMNGARWYCSDYANQFEDEDRVPVQVDSNLTRRDMAPTLPKPLVEIAGREYERQGYGQTFERLCERGGLSVTEIILLMGDAYERLQRERNP